MKKTVLTIVTFIAILIFCGCTYQNFAINTSSVETAAHETATAAIAEDTTLPPTTITSAAPISTITPNAQATFTLTKEDYQKLKAPLTVLFKANEFSSDVMYDYKNGLSKDNIAIFAWNTAHFFDYFYPSTSRYSEYFKTSNKKYGIKKGDLYNDNKYFVHIPQKAINSILMSTFGEEALKAIDLNGNIFNGVYNYGPKLIDGIYIFEPVEDYPEEDVMGPLDLPFKGNENTEFKPNCTVTYGDAEHSIVNYSIIFKLKKDDTSEWGYNITAFNMQEVK